MIVRGGDVHLGTGSLRYVGFDSAYWSSTTYSDTIYAYSLHFYSTALYLSPYDHQHYGFSVRGGYATLNTGSLLRAGNSSSYWTTTTYPNTTYAYYLSFNIAFVHPSPYYGRYYGFSIQSIRKSFVRGGYVDLNTGSLKSASRASIYWSTTTYPSATYAHYLEFNITVVYPSTYNVRYYGFSIQSIRKSFVRSGYVGVRTGSLRRAGRYGHYWSTTTYPNAIYAYYLDLDSDAIHSSNYDAHYGFSVRGGYIDLSTGSLWSASRASIYWSATAYSNATNSYDLYFNNTNILPSNYGSRFHGFSVHSFFVPI